MSSKAEEALRIARELYKQSKNWEDLHNAFFGIYGDFGKLFPTRAERESFSQTPEYQEILRLRSTLPRLRVTSE